MNTGPQTSRQGALGGEEHSGREPSGSSRKKGKHAVEELPVPARGGAGQDGQEEGLEEDEYEVEAILDHRRVSAHGNAAQHSCLCTTGMRPRGLGRAGYDT